jgi:hypothetical protein
MIKDLFSLVAPAKVEDLFAAVNARKMLFVRTGDSKRFSRLLPWSTVNTLLQSNPFGPGQLSVLQGSSTLVADMYRDRDDLSKLRLDSLQLLADQGLSLVINRVDDLVPAIGAFTAMLERHLRCTVAANGYLTFCRGGAFRPHWDSHDVLVLQLHGRKSWRVYQPKETDPVRDHAYERGAVLGPVLWQDALEPGDLLYLPRGHVHVAEVKNNEASAHLSLNLSWRRGADILAWLSESPDLDEALRMDIRAIQDIEQLQKHELSIKAALRGLADSLRIEDFLAWVDRRRNFRPAVNFGLGLHIDSHTWLQPAYRRRIVFSAPKDGFVIFNTGGTEHRVSMAAAELLLLIQDHDAITLSIARDKLQKSDEGELRLAARELAAKGLIYVDSWADYQP